MGDFDPLKLFNDEIHDDDHETTLNAINKLPAVGIALGPARVRNELLPLLTEYSSVDNDEGQTQIARHLGSFVEIVGGPTHAPLLLTLLEKYAAEEEHVVRDAAVESLCTICNELSRPDVLSKFVPVLKRLANGDWFTTRVSASGLFATVYTLVPDSAQAELRALFLTLCNDDTPMVRKAAFGQLGKFSLQLQRHLLKTEIYPIIKTVAQDDLDFMRIYAIESISALVKVVDPNEYAQAFIPIITGLSDDNSWRVRQALAKAMPALSDNVSPDPVGRKLVPLFSLLLGDREGEVRQAAASVMAEVCAHLKVGMMENIAPQLDKLASDTIPAVRIAFSSCVVQLCPVLGKETAAKVVLPLVQQLTKDENFEVRNNIISQLDVLGESIGPQGIVTSVLPQLLELAKDPKWRVRMGVISQSHLLSVHLGQKTFEKRFQSVLIGALTDHVFAIREKACEQIGLIVNEYGGKWAGDKFLPAAFAIYDKTTNYLHRMTCLLVIQSAASVGGPELAEKTMLPLVLQACTDDVANVRLGAAKALIELIPKLDPKVAASKLQSVVSKMTTDADPDVQYFSSLALKKIT